jgi:hypothetical protein
MALKCVLCGMAHLPNEVCGRDTEGGVARAFREAPAAPVSRPVEAARLERARAVLSEAEGRKAASAPPIAKQASESAVASEKFDRVAYQREYMRAYRARKKMSVASVE